MNVLVIGGIYREVLDADTAPRLRYGGSGLTASIASARFGARVALASYVGAEDEEAVRVELCLAGVDDRGVLSVTGASGIFVFPARYDQERPWPMYRPAEALPKKTPWVPNADVVLVFGIPDCDPIDLGWLDTDKSYGTVIWDRQGWLSRARDASAIVQIDAHRRIYVANELEAIEDARADSFDKALLEQPPYGFDAAVVKRGSSGIIVVERTKGAKRQITVPAYPVITNSTIGSGDVFAGAFAARLASGDSIDKAAKWGCAAASVSLQAGQNILDAESCGQARDLLLG